MGALLAAAGWIAVGVFGGFVTVMLVLFLICVAVVRAILDH